MMGSGFGMGGFGMGAFGGLTMIIFWVAVIVGIVLLVRSLASSEKSGGPAQEPAAEILRKRYARGEISREEFETGKRLIR
jgi:putative membrane protein